MITKEDLAKSFEPVDYTEIRVMIEKPETIGSYTEIRAMIEKSEAIDSYIELLVSSFPLGKEYATKALLGRVIKDSTRRDPSLFGHNEPWQYDPRVMLDCVLDELQTHAYRLEHGDPITWFIVTSVLSHISCGFMSNDGF